MTNRDIISRVRNSIKEHRSDSVLTNKHIFNILYTNAALLIKREADDKKSIYTLSNIWTTLCIEMEEVSSNLCTCVPIPVNCNIWRSKEKLPGFVETSSGILFKSITSIDGSEQLDIVTPYQYNLKSKVKYNKDKYLFIENGYLFSIKKVYPFLRITGYFTKLPKDTCVGTDSCTSLMDKPFPCPDYLLQPVVQMALTELGMFKQIPFDHAQNKNESS